MKIKVCGANVTLKFTTEPVLVDGQPVLVDGQPAYGYADFLSNEIVIAVMKNLDLFNTFIHEYTHWFNRFTMPNQDKEVKFDEEARCHYIGNAISCLIRENGIGIFDKIVKEYAKASGGGIQ